ncbi:MAG TPA: lactate utilization protein [Syntrophobacteraceae bacterium]|nr:lactate utilization protein [Syntrophobacteraceae bacterium]
MERPIDHFWQIRLNQVKKTLEEHNFEAFVADNVEEARRLLIEEIVPKTGAKSVSWGGSLTFIGTGLYEKMKAVPGLEVVDTYDKSIAPEAMFERRRQALLADLFITGTNAVTESGELVNLDMIGNRVSAIVFGPRNVVILVGRNKIVADLNDAMIRVKLYAAPVNAMRLDKKVPCVKTGECEDCKSPDRICNAWSIVEKSFPKGRIKVILINEDLGF